MARAFGITEDELISDLDVLPMCGTSFRGGDLLDIDTDGDRILVAQPGRRRRTAPARRRRGHRAARRRPRRRRPSPACARATAAPTTETVDDTAPPQSTTARTIQAAPGDVTSSRPVNEAKPTTQS
ncbi:hypothetical protein SBADM41S_03997 [Streptomyces badius]